MSDDTEPKIVDPQEFPAPVRVRNRRPQIAFVRAPALRFQKKVMEIIEEERSTAPDPATQQMPPPGGPPGGGPQGDDENFDLLRVLRAEVQDLRGVIEQVQAGKVTLESQTGYIAKTKSEVAALRQQIADEFVQDDTINHLLNVLQQMEAGPLFTKQATPLSAQEQTSAIAIFLEQVRLVELYVGMRTIPARLNEWLAVSKPGYYVPFHLVFRDEVPNDADRLTILNHIAWSPAVLEQGIVDVSHGLVFRFNKEAEKQQHSIAWLIAALLASLLIVYIASQLPWPGLTVAEQGQRATLFVIGWLAVLVGVVAHIGVDGIKREQETKLPTILAVANITEIIDARLGQILWKVLLSLIGLFAVVFAIDKNVSPINAFLVGYSLDSIVGLFGSTIETKVKAVESKLGGK